jgi:hypothetical protein
VGKIADAYIELGANDKPFKEKLKDIVHSVRRTSFNIKESLKEAFSADNVGMLTERLTGSGEAGQVAATLIASGFGKGMIIAGGLAAAVAGVAVALDQVFSRDDDQKFADSVAGLTSGFRGLSEEIKNTDKKIAEIMSRDATGGNGGWFSLSSWKALGERIVGIETMSSQIARNMNNAATASKLFADNLVRGAIGGQMQADQKRGAEAAAGLIQTSGQREEQRINAASFGRVVDQRGGIRIFEELREQFRKNPQLLQGGQSPMEAAQMAFGAMSRGDSATTRQFGDLFGVAEERAKILAEEFEAATGAGAELAQIEKDRIAKLKEFADADLARQQKATEQASKDMLKLEDQQATMSERLAQFQQDRAEQLTKSFQFAGLAEARDRLFMAAQDSKKDELTAGKMQAEIDRVVGALDKLKLKWEMN